MIEVFFDGGKKVNALADGFEIKTDQAVRSGGEGSAPEPFTLFLTSLATCAGIYVKSFCDQRGIPSDEIRLTQELEYNQALRMIGKFIIRIYVPDDFTEKYDHALINSAALCAVKRHLSDQIHYEITVERKGISRLQ